ncbi:fumarylacetoacetate hydrolase family protein [Neptunicella sp.]|uniref:fumarylacetoacetate hydrolase family protein n=1 Tax=Neptunicella sp. TaxID=2125986 RepID=UPI003F68E048
MHSIIVDGKTVSPSKVICVGRNYVEHIAELGNELPDEMVVFIKPNSAISAELKAFHQGPLHYEGELCFVYQGGRFSAVGFGLDLTKRDLQSKLKAKGLPWERAKAFDGAAVLGEFVSIEQIDDSLRLELMINDQLVQSGGVDLMMYKPDIILRELQQFITLQDGDVVMTGTPKGVGVIRAGDHFRAAVYAKDQLLTSAKWQAKN